MLWDYVLEYENPNVPAELQHELNGDHVSIGIGFDERERPSSCSDLIVREDPNQQAVSVSPSAKPKATEVLCSSIRTSFEHFITVTEQCQFAAPFYLSSYIRN